MIENIKKRTGQYWDRRRRQASVKENLKIYQRYVKNFANMETSLLQDYYEEKFFKFFAFLLQVVSFFTTYAGVAMYFGSIFHLAPLFIAVTIQGVLYMTAVSAFRPGKKNRRRKMAMFLCTMVSVAFSYTGLVTLANSPETDYRRAYESYSNTLQALQNEVKQKNSEADSLAADISSQYLKAIGTLQALDRRITALEEEAGRELDIPSVNTSTQTTTLPDGTVVRDNSKTSNPDYNEAVKAKAEAANDAVAARLLRDNLYQEIVDAAGAETEGADSNYANIREAVKWENLSQRIHEIMEAGDEDHTALQDFRQAYTRAALQNNSAIDNEVSGDIAAEYRMDETLLEEGLNQLAVYYEVAGIELTEWENLKTGVTRENAGLAGVISRMGDAIGADMYNGDMKQLMDLYSDMKEAVSDSYNQVTAVLPQADTYEKFSELTESRDRIMQLPEILTLAMERLRDPEYAGSAFVCLLLALLNDLSTVLLGWLGTKKAYSFLYVKAGKEHYDDVDELFGLVFQALQSQFVLGIRTGQFISMENMDFEQECLAYINRIVNQIRSFLESFSLSPCTGEMGYNLAWRFTGGEEIREYIPVISVLLKTNLLKIIPVSQYEYLEMEYYTGKVGHLWVEELDGPATVELGRELEEIRGKGHILLLRNKAENYLRENLTSTIVLEEK